MWRSKTWRKDKEEVGRTQLGALTNRWVIGAHDDPTSKGADLAESLCGGDMHSLVGRPGTTTAGFPRPHPLCGLATCCTHWEIGIRHPETRTMCLFFVWQIHNTFKKRKELPCSFDKIRLNGRSDYTYNLIIPLASRLALLLMSWSYVHGIVNEKQRC